MTRTFALVASVGVFSACAGVHEEADPKPVVTVKLAEAELMDVRSSVRAPAVVHPRQQANIASRLTAVIRELRVRKGDRVAAGAVLAKLDDRDLQAQRAEAQATLQQAEASAERRAKLFEEGAIPKRDLLATETEVKQAKARLDLVETQLQFSELKSPFDGMLTEQFMYPGDMARPDAPVFTIMDIEVTVARAQVPENEAGAVRTGQDCAFSTADHPGAAFEGRISVISRTVDPGRRTVEAWCELRSGGVLMPGAFGELRSFTGSARGSVVVPSAAVEFVEGTRKGSVLVVDDKQVAHRKEIEAGETLDGKLQILVGLKGGERVVVEGGYGVPDGTLVKLGDDKEDKKEDKEGEKKEKTGK